MTGQGVSSRSSHSDAAGRTVLSAKPWTQSRMSFWSWFSSSVNRGPSFAGAASPAASATISSAVVSGASVVVIGGMLHGTVSSFAARGPGGRRSEVAQVEGAQALGAVVGTVEEAAVHAVVGGAGALVCALDRELALGQRLTGHLHAAEAAGLQDGVEFYPGSIDALHAADVLDPGEDVVVAVEVMAADLHAASRLDHLVAEGAALATLACL